MHTRLHLVTAVLIMLLSSVSCNDPSKKYTTIFQAVETGDLPAVKAFVGHDRKAVNQVNTNPYNHNMPLHYALTTRQREIAIWLIKNGADINAKESYGETPLHLAVCNGDFEIVKMLVEKGVDVNQEGPGGAVPLHRAALNGGLPQQAQIVEFLLQKGAKPDIQDSVNGGTPLMLAVSWDYMEIVKLLVNNGADINKKNRDGAAALDIAISKKNKVMVDFLKSKGGQAAQKASREGQKGPGK